METNDKVREALERGLDKERHKARWEGMGTRVDVAAWWRQWALDLESNAREALNALTQPQPEAREERLFPMAGDADSKLGWTFDYAFLTQVSDATRDLGEYVNMEGVDTVLEALSRRAAIKADNGPAAPATSEKPKEEKL